MAEQMIYRVTEIRDIAIPMSDGTNLRGNLFLPEQEGSYPGVLNIIPYIKDSPARGHANENTYRHFASRGYAVMRADVRGTGTSGGVSPYPQDRQEAQDGHDVVEWMARQGWCTGKIGLWGTSNGGNSTISIAAKRPKHLSAIVPINGSYDTYNWFYKPNGCDGLFYGMRWGFNMAQSNLVPPLLQDPAGNWEQVWQERLEEAYPWLLMYYGEPIGLPDYTPVDDYPGRTIADFSRINVPTYAICGWRDAYRSPMLELYQGVDAPKRLLMGPWKHETPDQALIQPIGAIHEIDRWWDRWLKDIPNGIEDEFPITIFVQDSDTPSLGSGTWRNETEWPIARTESVKYFLNQNGLLSMSPESDESASDSFEYDPRVGISSIGDGGFPTEIPIPYDHSFDDLHSLTYTTEVFSEDVEITGSAVAKVHISAPVREPYLAAKLSIIRPDGSSHLIARGWANVTRENAHQAKDFLRPDEVREVTINIRPSSNRIRCGERLRLSLAGSDFPELWPTPEPYEMNIYRDASRMSHVELPIVPVAAEDLTVRELPPATSSPKRDGGVHRTSSYELSQDLVTRSVSYSTSMNSSGYVDAQTRVVDEQQMIMTTHADQPWNSNVRGHFRMTIERPTGDTVIDMDARLTTSEAIIEGVITEDGAVKYTNQWRKRRVE